MIKPTDKQKNQDLVLGKDLNTTPSKIQQSSIYNKSTNKKRRTQSVASPTDLLDMLFKQLDNLVQITTQEHDLFLRYQKENTLLHYQNRELEQECEVLEQQMQNLGQEESEMEKMLRDKNEEVKQGLQSLLRDIVRKQSDMMMYLENIIQFLED